MSIQRETKTLVNRSMKGEKDRSQEDGQLPTIWALELGHHSLMQIGLHLYDEEQRRPTCLEKMGGYIPSGLQDSVTTA